MAVIEDRAFFRFLKAQHQAYQRGFSAARAAHDRDVFPGFDRQAQIVQDIRRVLLIPEGHMAELDMPAHLGYRMLVPVHFRLRLQERFGHLQHRLDGRDGDRDAGQGGESGGQPSVSGVEGDIFARRHVRLHSQVIQDDRSAQRDG